ncbi:hypothetical protein, partial [Nostoc sp.]|uniref:hypothetical protein n=1 Tax=Nostoc sp. TaxID=1180 RepID=UPI002FF78CE5
MENLRQFSSTDLNSPQAYIPGGGAIPKPIATPPTSETRSPSFVNALKSVQQWQQERSEADPIQLQAYRDTVRRQLEGLPVASTPSIAASNTSQLTQIQKSTPERQPPPSTGSPPPTPNGTAARADSLVEPTALPRSATIREAIGNTVGGIGQSLPKSLPQSAGRLIVPGVGAG